MKISHEKPRLHLRAGKARCCYAKTAFWKNAENSFNYIPPLPHPQIRG